MFTTAGSRIGRQKSALRKKGDLLVHNSKTDVRLPVGSDQKFLIADPNQTTGLRWVSIDDLNHTNIDLGDELIIYDGSQTIDRKVQWDEIASYAHPSRTGFRLSLTSGTPVTTSDVTGAGTLYYTAYTDNRVTRYDTTGTWDIHTPDEMSLNLGTAVGGSAITSGKNYDVFVYYSGGAASVNISLELSAAWTNDTTRADALTRVNGVWVKSSDNTRRYVGTIRASGSGTTEDSAANRFVYNYYNPVPRRLRYSDSGGHTYGPGGAGNHTRQWNASSSAQINFVLGQVGEVIGSVGALLFTNTVGAGAFVSASLDSLSLVQVCGNYNSGSYIFASCGYGNDITSAGYHYVAITETIQGTATGTYSSCELTGWILA